MTRPHHTPPAGGGEVRPLDRARQLRAAGLGWRQIAAVLRGEYRLHPLVAMRTAHRLSQVRAASLWCQRWPAHPKTNKNFSYWENWPGHSGRPPSLPTLLRLAELYQCTVADLVAGLGDFTHLDHPTPPALDR